MSKAKKNIVTLLLATGIAAASIGVYAKGGNHAEKIAALESSISAAQAIKAATDKTGGQATEVDFEFKNGSGFYVVETVKDGQETDTRIDAKTGAIIESKADGAKTLPAVKLSLNDAIAKAEAQTQGKTKDADLKTRNNQSFYIVETVAKNQKHKVKIDANTGDVLETETRTKTRSK